MKKYLSIIIPMYNCENTILRCLESLYDTALKNEFEIIIINDGSKDKSLLICENFAKKYKNIKIENKENSGVSAARNTGIKVSKGSHLVFVDSDDYVEKDFVRKILELIDLNADLVIFNNYIETRGKKIKNLNYDKYNVNQEFISGQIAGQKLNPPWGKIFVKSIIEENKIYFDENLYLGEDFIFLLNYVKYVNSVKYSDTVIYNYIINDNSLSHSKVTIEKIKQLIYLFKAANVVMQDLKLDKNKFMISYIDVLFRAVLSLESFWKNVKLLKKKITFTELEELFNYKYSGKTALKCYILKKCLF